MLHQFGVLVSFQERYHWLIESYSLELLNASTSSIRFEPELRKEGKTGFFRFSSCTCCIENKSDASYRKLLDNTSNRYQNVNALKNCAIGSAEPFNFALDEEKFLNSTTKFTVAVTRS